MATAQQFDVVVVGSCVQDLVSYAPRFPRAGESVRGSRFVSGFGGKGANQCVQSAKLGGRCAMVGVVGDDVFGPATVANMKEQGVDCEHVHTIEGLSTGTATITVTEGGENSIVLVQGANDMLGDELVSKAESLIAKAKVLCVQLEIPESSTLLAMQLARKHRVTTIFNPAPAIPGMNVELLKYADIVCPNENETEMLSSSPPGSLRTIADAVRMANVIRSLGAVTVIVTLGARGCVVVPGVDGDHEHIPCPTVTKVVDTTGAGDSFVGALATLTAADASMALAERVRRACEVASISVQKAGTQSSYATKGDKELMGFVM